MTNEEAWCALLVEERRKTARAEAERDEARARAATDWQPIETAPKGEPHIRGTWVYSTNTGNPIYFAADAGYVDDDGAFVNMAGDDDYGWAPDAYDWWAPLPLPIPEAVRALATDDERDALEAVKAEERERCASVCDGLHHQWADATGRNPDDYTTPYSRMATLIREESG